MTGTETITVWKSASGEMFIAWHERHTSTIYPNEPKNIEVLANAIGTTVEKIQTAIKTYEKQEINRKEKIQSRKNKGEWWA